MIALIIILLLILLIFFVPYGIDAAYMGGGFTLRVKAGFLRFTLFPRKEKPKTEAQIRREEERKAKKAAKKAAKEAEKAAESAAAAPNAKKKPDIHFLLALARMGLRAVKRLFRSFSIDFLLLHYVAATKDPCDTAMQYSYLGAAFHAISATAGKRVRVKKSDVWLDADFVNETPRIEARLVLSLQLYKVVALAAAFGIEYLKWKKQHPTGTDTTERTDANGREQDQRDHGCNHEQDQTVG